MNLKISTLLTECISFFRNINLLFASAVLAFGLLQVTIADAFPGDLDRSFGQNGTVQLSTQNFDILRANVLQPDGKIIAVGAKADAPAFC